MTQDGRPSSPVSQNVYIFSSTKSEGTIDARCNSLNMRVVLTSDIVISESSMELADLYKSTTLSKIHMNKGHVAAINQSNKMNVNSFQKYSQTLLNAKLCEGYI